MKVYLGLDTDKDLVYLEVMNDKRCVKRLVSMAALADCIAEARDITIREVAEKAEYERLAPRSLVESAFDGLLSVAARIGRR